LTRVRANVFAVEKQKNIAYSMLVFVAYVIYQATRMCRIVSCGFSGFTIFFQISLNGSICGKLIIDHKMNILIFCSDLSETILILRRMQQDIIRN